MKVLYAIQGTGNGHLSRAQDVISALQRRVDLDVLVSGVQSDISVDFPVKYRYHGLSFFFGKKGGVNFIKTLKINSPLRVLDEVRSCPVNRYDLVINDFEPISAWACRRAGIPCVSMSHQAALLSSKVPRPNHQDWLGSFILKHYAPCNDHFSFHFKSYDTDMFTPIVRQEVRNRAITNEGHYVVYLPAYGDKQIIEVLSKFSKIKWLVFSKHTIKNYSFANVEIHTINSSNFIRYMASAAGILCGAGFETPAEALYLNKKLLVIPMKWQYEQHYNSQSLRSLGVEILDKLDSSSVPAIERWLETSKTISVNFPDQTQKIVDTLLSKHRSAEKSSFTNASLAKITS